MEEIFKIYKETNCKRCGHRVYEISNYGRLKLNGEIVNPIIHKGYYQYAGIGIHRAVAEMFIPNPENKREIDHIDNNKLNNHVDNLRWVTHKENMNNTLTLRRNGDTHRGKSYKTHTSRNKGKKRGPMPEEIKNKIREANKGKHWMTNGKEEMLVFHPWDKDMLIFGWQYGRLKK